MLDDGTLVQNCDQFILTSPNIMVSFLIVLEIQAKISSRMGILLPGLYTMHKCLVLFIFRKEMSISAVENCGMVLKRLFSRI